MQNLANALKRRRGKGINLQILIDPIEEGEVEAGLSPNDPMSMTPHDVSEDETEDAGGEGAQGNANDLGLAPEVEDTSAQPDTMKDMASKMGRGSLLDRMMKRK